MKNEFYNFEDKRMELFERLVKKGWNNELSYEELKKIANDFKKKYNFDKEDMPFINNHLRVAMGLDPNKDTEFSTELSDISDMDRFKGEIVTKIEGPCEYCDEKTDENECLNSCKYEAHIYRRGKGPVIVKDNCLNCGKCIVDCSFGAIEDKIEFLPIINMLKDKKQSVYATVAPSIVGQFGEDVTMGQLRTALKLMGFEDMIEVSLFADILTIKEAFEFNELVTSENDFFLTSCCCPVWLNLTEKNYPKLFNHMSPSISPMIASGRILKEFYPDSKVVFIGPCVAKKAEAKSSNRNDIDFVLTYRELDKIFHALNIKLSELPPDDKDQASFAGRVYARTGGVSFSVKTVVNRISPRRLIKFKSKKVDGVKDCKKILDDLSMGKDIDSNFIEGMGCEGGCVGGPRTNIDKVKATNIVNEFGEDSLIMTPFDNANVMKILKTLGVKKIEDVIEKKEVSDVFKRDK